MAHACEALACTRFSQMQTLIGGGRVLVYRHICVYNERFQVIGRPVDGVMVLFVVFTEIGSNSKENIRIISARKASKKERERYYSERKQSEQARGISAPE